MVSRLAERTGPCGAIRGGGVPCTCYGFEYEKTVAGYHDCVCGHSQGIHALGPPVLEMKEFELVKICPTCGQPLPTEEAQR
jgi:hypothetical protein